MVHHLLFNELGEEKLTGHVKHGLTAMNKFVQGSGEPNTRAQKSSWRKWAAPLAWKGDL